MFRLLGFILFFDEFTEKMFIKFMVRFSYIFMLYFFIIYSWRLVRGKYNCNGS